MLKKNHLTRIFSSCRDNMSRVVFALWILKDDDWTNLLPVFLFPLRDHPPLLILNSHFLTDWFHQFVWLFNLVIFKFSVKLLKLTWIKRWKHFYYFYYLYFLLPKLFCSLSLKCHFFPLVLYSEFFPNIEIVIFDWIKNWLIEILF